MRKNSILTFLLINFVMFVGSFWVGAAPLGAADPPAPQAYNVGYLENIALESLAGKERITITVSRLSNATVENQLGNALLVKLDNMIVPQDFRNPRGEGILRNVLRILPAQKVLEGKQWAYLTIDLKERVPHSVRQEGQNILIDFNVAALKESASLPGAPKDTALKDAAPQDKVAGSAQAPESKNYDGRLVTIDFQDADIKSVLLGLAKLADVNIVSGDDVKGKVTIQMKNVPWEQALNTILTITGLSKRQDGNVITVMEQAKLKKSEDDRAAWEKEKARKEESEQLREPLITRVVPIAYNKPEEVKKNIEELLKSTDAKDSKDPKDPKQPPDSKAASSSSSVTIDNHTNSLIIKATRRDMDNLLRFIEKIDKPTAQIMIKANIVETTKNTARDLGIQWGGMWGQKIGGQGLYVTPGGTGGSAVPPGNAFSGGYTPAYGSAGISGQGYGVNFPAAVTGAASLGLMFGSIGENILELQLSALQKDGKLNILSSPSITTLDNQIAFTENGEKIPYVSIDKNGSPNVQFQDAVLRLEITPHIVDDKSLKMLILVKKDEVDTARSVSGNPFIVKKQTQTNLIVQDGETIVISGLTKQKTTENISGVPWLKDIPVLGWLFKGEGKGETMEEVLIFITPTIIKPQEVAGIQTGS